MNFPVLTALGVMLLAACAKTPPPKPTPVTVQPGYVVLLPNADGSVGKVTIKGKLGDQTLDAAGVGAPLNGASAPAPVTPDMLQKDFGAAMRAVPLAPEQFYLFFQTGGSKFTPESEALIPTILDKIKARESADVSVVGHSDTQGKADANARLAYQRAQSTARMLRDRGMQPATLTVESHGETNLLVQTPDETAEPRNRRVEISVR
jgi:peptidoglycan-associated lipoprotein